MAHLQYLPGDPRLVDQLVYELKSKGIFDQFRKECIADVDTRPAYQNLRQRVENSVATFLSRQCWKPDLNKNQLREKLRKHILDGNYLEQGVERIVDQVVNPKVASVFIPQVEDLVYNYLGITRKKSVPATETTEKVNTENDLLPTDLEAVSPGSVKSHDDKSEPMEIGDTGDDTKMDIDDESKPSNDVKDETLENGDKEKTNLVDTPLSGLSEVTNELDISMDKSTIPLPAPKEVKLENIPWPENSPPKVESEKVEHPMPTKLTDIPLPETIQPKSLNDIPFPDEVQPKSLTDIPLPDEVQPKCITDIPLPEEMVKAEKDRYFKPLNLLSDDDDSSSDSSLRRNMSPLTPIRNFDNENSCDAQQGFDNDSGDSKSDDKKETNSFRFAIDAKSSENSSDELKTEKKDTEQTNLSYQFNNQVNINTFNTPMYDDSSNSNNLRIDYESDANSKTNTENKAPEIEQQSEDVKSDKKHEEKKSSSNKSSHRSRDSHRHSSSKDRRSDSKHSSSRDSRNDKKSSKDDHKSKSNDKEKDRSDKKDSRDSSKHRSSHKSSSHRDSKSQSHRSSSSSKHSSKHDDKKSSSSSSHRDKKESSSSKDKSKDKDSRSSSHRSDKDRKSSSKSKSDEKDKDKKEKKETDDHYSVSGRGNHGRRSTDRDSNDGSSSSKGSHNPSNSKSESKKDSKSSSSKSENTSASSDSTSPSDKEVVANENKSEPKDVSQSKPIVRVDTHLETPIAIPPRLPFVPDVTLKKPKIAANLEEAKKLMKMRKFLDDEQKRMNQEAALLLEFQANVRPSLSRVYSSIPGPELEFACVTHVQPTVQMVIDNQGVVENGIQYVENVHENINGTNTIILQMGDQENVSYEPTQQAHETNVIVDNQYEEMTEIENEVIRDMNAHVKYYESKTLAEGEANYQQTENQIIEESNTNEVIEEQIENVEVPIENACDTQPIEGVCVIREEENINIETIDHTQVMNVVESDDVVVDNLNDPEKSSVDLINSIIEENEIKEHMKNDTAITEENEIKQILKNENTAVKNADADTKLENLQDDENKKRTEFFEVTVITEEVSESEIDKEEEKVENVENKDDISQETDENLKYFAEHEKYEAELERAKFSTFLKSFIENTSNKLYLINCDTYEENIVREISENFGKFEIVNYFKNGHLKLSKPSNIVKDVNVTNEITLPLDTSEAKTMFSPVKSECSFELSSDYDAKLEDMVNKTSRQQILEIILGGGIEESPTVMPTIDYCVEEDIERDSENSLKRKYSEVESTMNNNRPVLTPNKIRRLSGSDQITSTTPETEERPVINNTRSKYLGRARRVGLPKPRKTTLPNSPSSDKSVENYEQNTQAPEPINGKIRNTSPRAKVQRYDTSDLYKPKLHYLSRRNNIS